MMSGVSIISEHERVVLSDLAAVRHLVRQRLMETMQRESLDNDNVELWADAFDEGGARVLATRLLLRVIEP